MKEDDDNPIEELLNRKMSDEMFREEIKGLDLKILEALEERLWEIHNECKQKLKDAANQHRQTGELTADSWWNSCSKVASIRRRQARFTRWLINQRGGQRGRALYDVLDVD
jgi:hypothetical protein